MARPKIFLSYSHRDEEARDQLLRFLKPLERAGLVDLWADTRLDGGDLWRREIEEALASATVAVFLISQDFLASDFIVDREVPPLLERAVAGGLVLIPVFLSPSSVCEVDFPLSGPQGKIQLAEFQGVGSPGKTLKEMSRVERERKFTELAARLKDLAEIHPAPSPTAAVSEPAVAGGATRARSTKIEGTAKAQPPTPPKVSTLREALGTMWREKPLDTLGALAGLLVGIPTVLSALGYLTLRQREKLIGLPEPLDYPKPQWIATGADVLWSLPYQGLWSLVAEFPTIQYGAWALSGLVLALLSVRFLRRRHNVVRLALLSFTLIVLARGGFFYRVAIYSKPPCSEGSSQAEVAAFETCSWLTNDGPVNDQRRLDLGGLLAWMLAAGVVAFRVAAGSPEILHPWAARLRWVLRASLLGLILFFFVPLLPRAHAVGEWGLRYPAVTLQIDNPDCRPELARALADGKCCAIDISQGATEKYLYVNGLDNCPFQFQRKILSLKATHGNECIERLPDDDPRSKRVIYNGC